MVNRSIPVTNNGTSHLFVNLEEIKDLDLSNMSGPKSTQQTDGNRPKVLILDNQEFDNTIDHPNLLSPIEERINQIAQKFRKKQQSNFDSAQKRITTIITHRVSLPVTTNKNSVAAQLKLLKPTADICTSNPLS